MSLTFDPATDIPDLAGKTIVVTGGNAGLGAATVAAIVARNPARVFLTARRRAAADDFVETLKELPGSTAITVVDLDLASLASVRAAGEQILREAERIDLLVLNAGVAWLESAVTPDGYEVQFGTNHVGHAMLTQLLMPALLRAARDGDGKTTRDVRVVVLSSQALRRAGGIAFDALKTPMADVWGMQKYAQSKLAKALFAFSLAEEYPAVTAVAVHPGVVNTPIFGKATGAHWLAALLLGPIVRLFGVTAVEGARNQLWAAFATEGVASGKYYEPIGRPDNGGPLSQDKELARRLWDWTDAELKANGGPGWPSAG